MNRDQILNKLNEIFLMVFQAEILLTEKMSAEDVKGWDSVSNVTLTLVLEEKFGISFPIGSMEKAMDIGELIDLIIKLKGNE